MLDRVSSLVGQIRGCFSQIVVGVGQALGGGQTTNIVLELIHLVAGSANFGVGSTKGRFLGVGSTNIGLDSSSCEPCSSNLGRVRQSVGDSARIGACGTSRTVL